MRNRDEDRDMRNEDLDMRNKDWDMRNKDLDMRKDRLPSPDAYGPHSSHTRTADSLTRSPRIEGNLKMYDTLQRVEQKLEPKSRQARQSMADYYSSMDHYFIQEAEYPQKREHDGKRSIGNAPWDGNRGKRLQSSDATMPREEDPAADQAPRKMQRLRHFLLVEGLSPATEIALIPQIFCQCNLIQSSTKLIRTQGETFYAYIEVSTPKDVFTACQMNGRKIGNCTISLKPVFEKVMQQDLDSIPFSHNKQIITMHDGQSQKTSNYLSSPLQNERTGDVLNSKSLGFQTMGDIETKSVPAGKAEEARFQPLQVNQEMPIGNTSRSQLRKPLNKTGLVVFDGMPSGECLKSFPDSVLGWIKYRMSHVEVVGDPYVERSGKHCIVTLKVVAPVYPSFPPFTVLNKVACKIRGPEQTRSCPACRVVHDYDSRLTMNPCLAFRKSDHEGRNIAFIDDVNDPLSPFSANAVEYLKKSYYSISSALHSMQEQDFQTVPDRVSKFEVLTWQAKSYGLILDLYKNQIETNPAVAFALKNTRDKRIVYVSEDRVLGSGKFPDIDVKKLEISYLPGANYVGRVLEELRTELFLAERGEMSKLSLKLYCW